MAKNMANGLPSDFASSAIQPFMVSNSPLDASRASSQSKWIRWNANKNCAIRFRRVSRINHRTFIAFVYRFRISLIQTSFVSAALDHFALCVIDINKRLVMGRLRGTFSKIFSELLGKIFSEIFSRYPMSYPVDTQQSSVLNTKAHNMPSRHRDRKITRL